MAVIPARYASTRFPGKPLAELGNKPIVQWVWERVSGTEGVSTTVVATDDERIKEAVEAFGGEVVMTSSEHRSGTDRCGEVLRTAEAQGTPYDIVVNVQGDEPFIQQGQISQLLGCFTRPATDIATLRTAITDSKELLSPNNVKVVTDAEGRALYFSRQPIPYLRGIAEEEWTGKHKYYKHVGIYAFRRDTLHKVVALPYGELERCESLEQLRWIENGYSIQTAVTEAANIGIDTLEDLAAAEHYLKEVDKKNRATPNISINQKNIT